MSPLEADEAIEVLTFWRDGIARTHQCRDGPEDSEMTKTKTKTELSEVRFYRASEKPYGAFSNLYKREIEFEDEKFATSEHAYQAGKARKPEVRKC